MRKVLNVISSKFQFKELETKKESEWPAKYAKLQEFNKELMVRLRAEQEKSKSLESGGKSLKESIKEKEAEIKAESERVDSLQKELAALVANQSHYNEQSIGKKYMENKKGE